jgi:peptidoglycan/LPS O-acetylase OafA/YrhL
VKLAWIFVLIPFVILVAWLALKLYDEPIRAWLTRRYGIRRAEA